MATTAISESCVLAGAALKLFGILSGGFGVVAPMRVGVGSRAQPRKVWRLRANAKAIFQKKFWVNAGRIPFLAIAIR